MAFVLGPAPGSENQSFYSEKSGFPHKLDHVLAVSEDKKSCVQNDAQKNESKCEEVGEFGRQANVVDSGGTSDAAIISASADGECKCTHEQSRQRWSWERNVDRI